MLLASLKAVLVFYLQFIGVYFYTCISETEVFLILFFDRKSPLWGNKNEWAQQPFSHHLQNGKSLFLWEGCFVLLNIWSDKSLLCLLLLDNWKPRTKWPCKCKLWWSSDGVALGKKYSKKLLSRHLSREFTVAACLWEKCYFRTTLQACFVVNFYQMLLGHKSCFWSSV